MNYLGSALLSQSVEPRLSVVAKHYADGPDNDPPTLLLGLSDGRFVKLTWDMDYSHFCTFIAADKSSPYVAAPNEADDIWRLTLPFRDEIYASVHEWANFGERARDE